MDHGCTCRHFEDLDRSADTFPSVADSDTPKYHRPHTRIDCSDLDSYTPCKSMGSVEAVDHQQTVQPVAASHTAGLAIGIAAEQRIAVAAGVAVAVAAAAESTAMAVAAAVAGGVASGRDTVAVAAVGKRARRVVLPECSLQHPFDFLSGCEARHLQYGRSAADTNQVSIHSLHSGNPRLFASFAISFLLVAAQRFNCSLAKRKFRGKKNNKIFIKREQIAPSKRTK